MKGYTYNYEFSTQWKQAIFTGAWIVDPKLRDLIKNLFKEKIGNLLPEIKDHHMTCHFRPTYDQFINLVYGQHAKLHMIGLAGDDKAQAILVQTELETQNIHPHITVAVNKTPPKYSNELIAKGPVFYLPKPIILEAKIGYYTGQEIVYEPLNNGFTTQISDR